MFNALRRTIIKIKADHKRKLEKQVADIALETLKQNNSFIYDVSLIERRPFYDTRWQIITKEGPVVLVRDEKEKIEPLCYTLQFTKTIEDIRKLDEKNKIVYD